MPHSRSRSPGAPSDPQRPSGTRLPRVWAPWVWPVALLIVAFMAGRSPAETDDVTPSDTVETDIISSVTRPVSGTHEVSPAPTNPVRAGESLRFSVQYGVIHAGSAYLEVPEVKDWNGRQVYDLVARAESNSFFSHIYKVRNRIESFWDKEGLFSWRYAENRREGHFKAQSEILFDYGLHEAHYSDGRSFPVPQQVQDALSSFYYTRFQALPIGGSIVFEYHASRKSQPLEVRVLGRERVKVPAGTFDCIVIEPVLKAGGIFKNKGRLVIWMTDDQRRIPVLMKSKVLIGSISVVLQEVKQGA